MNEEESAYVNKLQSENEDLHNRQSQMVGATSMYAQQQDPNLIEWQLELDNILERLEHLLRGDVLKLDKKGNVNYLPADDDDLKPLNEYGVQFIMNILSSYLNRNTILSNYGADRIREILYDVGYEVTDQIYLNSDKMGLDTPDKRKRYPIIVLQIIHTIESAYNRAFRGQERDSLRSARVVTQQANPMMNQPYPMIEKQQEQKISLFHPSTWVR